MGRLLASFVTASSQSVGFMKVFAVAAKRHRIRRRSGASAFPPGPPEAAVDRVQQAPNSDIPAPRRGGRPLEPDGPRLPPERERELEEQAIAYYQTASREFRSGAYRLPPRRPDPV
jgi:hypothetical protein